MTEKSFFHLDKNQITVIKGLAIIMIVLHNFLHWTNNIGENELNYDASHLKNLQEIIITDPFSIFSGLFSYFGHFGVQLFILVSAYGLTKKYLTSNKNIDYKIFIISRFVKIYSLVLVGLALMLCLDTWKGNLDIFMRNVPRVLLMTNNFSYDRIFSYVGPWWFFGLILQLYFIFPFIYRYLQNNRVKGFYLSLAISYMLMYIFFPLAEKFNIPLFGNFAGHLPEFLLGIALASFPKFKLNVKMAVAALVVFVLSNISPYAFPMSFLSATILLLWLLYPVLVLSEQNFFRKFCFFTGNISMFLFVINGPLRFFTIDFIAGKSLWVVYAAAILHLLITIGIAYIVSLIYDRTLLPVIQKIN